MAARKDKKVILRKEEKESGHINLRKNKQYSVTKTWREYLMQVC